MPVRILIVENDRSIAKDLASRLSRFGYEMAGIFDSGSEGIKNIKEGREIKYNENVKLSGNHIITCYGFIY